MHARLVAGGQGHLVFETRDPANRAWQVEWTRSASRRVVEVTGVGDVETWVDVVDRTGPLVTFVTAVVCAKDGVVLTSTSTLRFRERGEVEATLAGCGYIVEDVRGAPDRPGREQVFIASPHP